MISAVAETCSAGKSRAARVALVTIAAAAIGLLVLGSSCTDEQAIDRLTIVNRTPFDVEVKVTDSEKEGWLILGQAEHEASTLNELVTDMGETWVFQFHYGGEVVGDLTVKRDDLIRDKWRVEVPAAVAERMRRLGFEPPPDR